MYNYYIVMNLDYTKTQVLNTLKPYWYSNDQYYPKFTILLIKISDHK